MSSPSPTGSLGRRLIAVFGLVALLPLAATVGLSYWSSRDVVAGLLEENLGKTARLYASEVDDFLAEKTGLLTALAGGIAPEEAVLTEVVARSPMIEELLLIDATGQVIARSDGGAAWAVEACRSGEPGIAPMTHAHHGQGHEVVVSVAHAGGGRLCGRVSFTLHQDMISERARSTFGGLAYIVDRNGDVVCHAFEEDEPHVHPGEPILGPAAEHARNGVAWHGIIESDGARHLAAFAPATNLPWGVWAEVPLAEASSVLRPLSTRALLFGGLLTGVLSLVILVLVRRIAAPIEELAAASQRIAAGAIGETVPVRGNDEISQLAREFNTMSTALAESVRDLDAKVAARTLELEETQAHLVHQEKMAAVGTLAAGLAHEIGNPLASLSSELQLLAMDPSAAPDALPVLQDQVRRMGELLKELAELGRAPSDQKKRFDAMDVVDDVLRLIRHGAREHGVQLERRAPETPISMCSSRDRLVQVLLNLGLNAIDALEDGGTVTFAVEAVGDGVRFVVSDDGPGLPEPRDRLFEPFFTTKPVGQGTGLGLFVVDRIVSSLKGTITAGDSRDGGAVFTLDFPDCSCGDDHE